MSDNSRKLLPYEHQLIEALGISKEEYLEFVAIQQEYTDPKQGTIFDVRNLPPIIPIILTAIGVILQVVAALIPKPAQQSASGQRQQTRDDVFAPRFGFNSAQELARYGDPVNLIYTNKDVNKNGGVRVATALIWSAVKSFGSSQYVQMLMVLGAGGIGDIDEARTAFGQTPLRDLIAQNYWLYFRPDKTGVIRGTDKVAGGNGEADPAASKVGTKNLYRIVPSSSGSSGDGFSHALSPTISNRFGVYSPVPINIDIVIRNQAGAQESTANLITANTAAWGSGKPKAVNGKIAVGEKLTIRIKNTKETYKKQIDEEAAEQRRALSSAFDNAGIFKLGSAHFSVISVSNGSTDDGDIVVSLTCIKAGRAPSVPYSVGTPAETAKVVANNDPTYNALKKIVDNLLSEDQNPNTKTAQDLLKKGYIQKYKKGGVTYYGKGSYYKKNYLAFSRNLTKQEKQDLKKFIDLNEEVKAGGKADDYFFIKALARMEKASYETVSPCHIVDLALKARVFKRISGRQEKYGSKNYAGYDISDNGIKMRVSMFIMRYKKASSKGGFVTVPGIFAVRRAADNDNFIYIRFNSGLTGLGNDEHWQFELEPIHDPIAEAKANTSLTVNGKLRYFYLENSGKSSSINLPGSASIQFTGTAFSSPNQFPPRNKAPELTNEWDLFSNTADTQLQLSIDNGPELTLTAVSEQIRTSFSNFPGLYKDLSLVGLNLYSGRSVQDLRSLSLFVTKGRKSRLLRTSGKVNDIAWGQPGYSYLPASANGYANTAPDIFVDTVLDSNDGIGEYTGDLFSIDIEQLARSKKFCEVNKLFMDGVIAEPTSWREFWSSVAGFSLLELAKKDGKEALVPAVPYNPTTGKIEKKLTISALFNPGNILEDSYKEEFLDYGANVQDVIITIIFRKIERDGVFARNDSVEVKLKDTDESTALRQTIDMSSFVTNKDQALLVAKYLCLIKRHSRRGIEFKTFPNDSFVEPGGYIYVELAQNSWDNIRTGTIGENGKLDFPLNSNASNGQYQVLLYDPNAVTSGTVYLSDIAVTGGIAEELASYKDYVFVLGTAIRNKRTFRVVEVAMDEEGEVTVKAVEHRTNTLGESLIALGLLEGDFTIDGKNT